MASYFPFNSVDFDLLQKDFTCNVSNTRQHFMSQGGSDKPKQTIL